MTLRLAAAPRGSASFRPPRRSRETKRCGSEPFEYFHRRDVERLVQGFGDADRAAEVGLEIARLITREGLWHVGEQRFGMGQSFVEGQAVEEGLQGRTGRARRLHHIHMRKARVVAEIGRAGVGAHFERLVIDHQCCHRYAWRQQRQPGRKQVFDRLLQARVDGAVDARELWSQSPQAFGEQRREERLADALRDHRFLTGVGDHRRAPARLQAIEDLVARLPGSFRVAVGAQPRRGLRQHGEQCRFGFAQA
jgi:hypothetical protein